MSPELPLSPRPPAKTEKIPRKPDPKGSIQIALICRDTALAEPEPAAAKLGGFAGEETRAADARRPQVSRRPPGDRRGPCDQPRGALEHWVRALGAQAVKGCLQ